MSLHPGKQVSTNLRLSRMLGRGAMGSVWLADHLTLQSQVAVKFMSPAMAEDETSVLRFQQEAKAAAEIRSPYVAQVFDHGRADDGQLFIVMEYLEGQSLERRVRQLGALRPLAVARIIGQVCKALAKAHERGIVHRDIKPSNVFIIDSGNGEEFAKLLDFGVAKFSGEEAVNMTAAGNMVGTPAFMSPEQLFHGTDIDGRGDLWSVAVVAYYALTGQRPFHGKTLGELAVQIKGGIYVHPTELRNDLPPDVDAWFARALNLDIESRFRNAKEMAQAFEQACGATTLMSSTPSGVGAQLQTFPGTSLSSTSVVAPINRDRRMLMGLAVGALLLLGGGGAGFVLLGGSERPTDGAAVAPADALPNGSTAHPEEPPPAPPPARSITPADTAHDTAAEGASSPPKSSASTPTLPKRPTGGDRPPAPTPTSAPKEPTSGQDDRTKQAGDQLGI